MGFHFYDSNSTAESLQRFSVTIASNMKLNNLTVRCGAKETEESDPIFNLFQDIIVVEKGE